MSFPLLHVTDLVFEEIVNQMELNEIFSLSLCSRYTCDVVKCHLRKSIKYPLYVDAKLENVLSVGFISNDGPVVIMSIEDFDRWDGTRLEEVNIGGCKTRIAKNGNHCVMLHSSTGKMHDCFEIVMEYTKDLFHVEIDSLYCMEPWTIEFVRSRQKAPLRMTYVTDTNCDFRGVTIFSIVANGKTGGLQFDSKFPEDNVLPVFNGSYQYLRFKHGRCEIFDIILIAAQNNREAIFDEADVSSRDISRFYKLWSEDDDYSRLKLLLVRVNDYNEEATLSRVQNLVAIRPQRVIYGSYSLEKHCLNPGLFLIRSDGVAAGIYYDPSTRILRFCRLSGFELEFF
uniref:F-box domain-containing protein n=1 Tax=Caenorhabditis tropicalis TaxID=1561998 RepID=A0A1I7T6T8_9PELO